MLFTDWKSFVAVHVRVTKKDQSKELQVFDVAYRPGRTVLPSGPSSSFEAFHSGLRHALCMLGVDALRELGILRRDVSYHPLSSPRSMLYTDSPSSSCADFPSPSHFATLP